MSDHIYIHVPFCLKKCGYCDFYSGTDLALIPDFTAALSQEIRLRAPAREKHIMGGRPDRSRSSHVKTVYFGGGTPSLLPLDALKAILDELDAYYVFSETAEFTIEVNPGCLDKNYLRGLKNMGFNRLSIGVQSFFSEKLSFLGRGHNRGDAANTVECARTAGFDNIGLDLIYGLPGESRQAWQKDLDTALTFAPEHLSCYMLTLEPGTPLDKKYQQGGFSPMSASGQVDLFSFTSGYLSRAGYEHYEISNFAKGAEFRSRHNSGYWEMAPYTGFGPSAHSLAFKKDDQGKSVPVRSWNLTDLSRYIHCLSEGGLPVDDSENISESQQLLEMAMVGLRTTQGVDINAFDTLSQKKFTDLYKDLLQTLVSDGLGQFSEGKRQFLLTRAGWARLDNIVEKFADPLL
ncbi:MAG: radical SAM family heme chaperone HemW [Desulfobacter sp.]